MIPPAFKATAEELKISPGLVSGNHVFLTGTTGGDQHGKMPDDPSEQFRNVFDKIELVLREADLTFAAVVEMTSYHIGLREHFDLFQEIRTEYITEPSPAWTVVEVAGLRRVGAIVEVRVVACLG